MLGLLVQLIFVGLIFYILWWGLGKIALPEPFNKVAIVVLVLLTVVVLINIIMGVSGISFNGPLLHWK